VIDHGNTSHPARRNHWNSHLDRHRAGLLIGIYLTALSLGAVTGSLLSVPLYQASGGSVRLVLGWIALPAALATLLWLPQARHTIRAVVPARARAQMIRSAPGWGGREPSSCWSVIVAAFEP
jgi:cyanate permease